MADAIRTYFDTIVSLEGMLDCEIEEIRREYGTLENYASFVVEDRRTELMLRCAHFDIFHPYDVLTYYTSKTSDEVEISREPSLECLFYNELDGDDVKIYGKGMELYLENGEYICRIFFITSHENLYYPSCDDREDEEYLKMLMKDKRALLNPGHEWFTFAQKLIDEERSENNGKLASWRYEDSDEEDDLFEYEFEETEDGVIFGGVEYKRV